MAIGRPAELVGETAPTEIRYRRNGREFVLQTHEPTRVLHELTGQALAEGYELEELHVRRPTLEAIAEVLPMTYLIRLVRDVALRDVEIWSRPGSVAVVAAWGAAGLLVALRGFRWMPREQ